jgi:glucose-1-phosphate thymidylyltransferase
MKGILLAGGTGSRLFPLTKVTNKHLLPIGRYPMIFWPLHQLLAAEIREIMIVTGVEHMAAIVGVLGSGRDFGAEFTYRVQDDAGGIAQALGLCRGFVGGETAAVLLGDNIFVGDLRPVLADFGGGARLLLSECARPERFGVAEFDGAGRLVRIVEKPAAPPSRLAVTGCYLYDSEAFAVVALLRPSARGELEITDVNNHYIARGCVEHRVWTDPWSDAGTFESLAEANLRVRGVRLERYER